MIYKFSPFCWCRNGAYLVQSLVWILIFSRASDSWCDILLQWWAVSEPQLPGSYTVHGEPANALEHTELLSSDVWWDGDIKCIFDFQYFLRTIGLSGQ